MEVYLFMFNPCIHESASFPISIHKTKKGAYKAMNKWINDLFMDWWNDWQLYGKDYQKFGIHEAWFIMSEELQD